MAQHLPVMSVEVVAALAPSRGGLFVDCTVGLGGHARALIESGASRVIGLDRDPDALARAAAVLAPWGERVELVQADYRDIERVLDERSVGEIAGAVADLGVSSLQLDGRGRGFSFRRDEPLDMRMDASTGPTAADMLAAATETELADVIFHYGEERRARAVARAIVALRQREPLRTTGQLAAVVRRVVGRPGSWRIDPATRTFQAIRIWVNRELEGIDTFLRAVCGRLQAGGRFVVVTFHSLEDRPVKHTFRDMVAGGASYRLLTRKPLVPRDDEMAGNPRARSAKLRAIERLGE
ncbi:MAG: 16S rRNA (cytosine(1402)-N(4))-methyltransferase RsmH [Acidobacteriota bacterium]